MIEIAMELSLIDAITVLTAVSDESKLSFTLGRNEGADNKVQLSHQQETQ